MLNLAALERALRKKHDEGKAATEALLKKAEDEKRALTDEERADIRKHLDETNALRDQVLRARGDGALMDEFSAALQAAGGQAPASTSPFGQFRMPKSLGQQFIESDAFAFHKSGGHRTSSAWRSPSAELFDPMRLLAATLTEDPASGGKLILPQYVGGILPLPQRPTVVGDLFAQGTATSNAISYMVEKLFTNAAAAVAEGAAKPESTLTFDAATDPVRKIAHWLPVTDEMLEDAPQIASYIDARLRLGVELAEEDELLNGTGVAPHILGLLLRPGLAPDVSAAVGTAVDAIFTQIMAIYGSAYLMPDGIVMNPGDWGKIALMKTTTGEYLAGGPFSTMPAKTLWGLSVAVTPVIAKGTAVVGAFKQGGQVFRKGGIRVESSNSHQDYFIKNLTAIRAEERLALAVYRPGAFGKVIAIPAGELGALGNESGRGGPGYEAGRNNVGDVGRNNVVGGERH